LNKLFFAAVLMFCLYSCLARAQSPFDGTWKLDMSTAELSQKPISFLVDDGTYECTTCTPPARIKADGRDQEVTGDPYHDTRAIKIISDHEVEMTDKKNGKTVRIQKLTVSADGNTMTVEFSNSSNTNAAPVTGKGELARVAKGPAGSNAISGSWQTARVGSRSDNNIMWTYKVTGDELAMNLPTGQSFIAKLNGPEAPFRGDPGITGVSIKTNGKDTLQEINMRGDKVYFLFTMTLEPDGKTARIVREDKLQSTTEHYLAVKQ
jgi:hypothetical protein